MEEKFDSRRFVESALAMALNNARVSVHKPDLDIAYKNLIREACIVRELLKFYHEENKITEQYSERVKRALDRLEENFYQKYKNRKKT